MKNYQNQTFWLFSEVSITLPDREGIYWQCILDDAAGEDSVSVSQSPCKLSVYSVTLSRSQSPMPGLMQPLVAVGGCWLMTLLKMPPTLFPINGVIWEISAEPVLCRIRSDSLRTVEVEWGQCHGRGSFVVVDILASEAVSSHTYTATVHDALDACHTDSLWFSHVSRTSETAAQISIR